MMVFAIVVGVTVAFTFGWVIGLLTGRQEGYWEAAKSAAIHCKFCERGKVK